MATQTLTKEIQLNTKILMPNAKIGDGVLTTSQLYLEAEASISYVAVFVKPRKTIL